MTKSCFLFLLRTKHSYLNDKCRSFLGAALVVMCDCGLALEVDIDVVGAFINRVGNRIHTPELAVVFCFKIESTFSHYFLSIVDVVNFGSNHTSED